MIDVPFKISFKDMPDDDSLTGFIRRRIARLERIYSRMVTGSILLEKSQKHSSVGGVYRIRLELFVPPRKELVVKRNARVNEIFPDMTLLITDAFEAAETQLQKEKTRHKGKHTGHTPAGRARSAAGPP